VVEGASPETRTIKIVNTKGLHARASAKFVQCTAKFDATVMVTKEGSGSVTGTSIMGLMMLGAGIGSELVVTATGREAHEALNALETLIANKFGEES
jgi:phosphocarrier protein HPr